jgi:SHS2 domain-containing protein
MVNFQSCIFIFRCNVNIMLYEILDHTADLKIKVFGDSMKSIFENSVAAISDLIIDSSNMECSIARKIQIKENNCGDMLIRLLNDILFYLETENIIFCKSKFEFYDGKLTGMLYGSRLNPGQEYKDVIKAATYYNLSINPEQGYAIIVLDV